MHSFPHTNYNVFTIGCYLNDTGLEDGPLAVMPGSHQGELYNLYHGETWAGCLTDEDAGSLSMEDAEYLTGGEDRSPSTIAGPFIFLLRASLRSQDHSCSTVTPLPMPSPTHRIRTLLPMRLSWSTESSPLGRA